MQTLTLIKAIYISPKNAAKKLYLKLCFMFYQQCLTEAIEEYTKTGDFYYANRSQFFGDKLFTIKCRLREIS